MNESCGCHIELLENAPRIFFCKFHYNSKQQYKELKKLAKKWQFEASLGSITELSDKNNIMRRYCSKELELILQKWNNKK